MTQTTAAPDHESTRAWRELLEGLAGLDASFLAGSRRVLGERATADGYRMLATVLGVGLDTYLFSDPARPCFMELNTPTRRDLRWGGDNTDAFYHFITLDPRRTYRVHGTPGDSSYYSLTVYNEPSPGAWSTRVDGVVKDTDMRLDSSGEFEMVLGPVRPDGYDGAFVELQDDSAAAMTRDYHADPATGRPVSWHVEILDHGTAQPPGDHDTRATDAAVAQGFRSTLTWLQTMFAILPLAVGIRGPEQTELGHEVPTEPNAFAEPYRVPDFNFGWSATDACYAFGSYDLEPDEAMVITHRPPSQSRFWNLNVWNQFMGGHNADDARTSLNSATARPNSDGTVTAVISRERSSHPNALTTMGAQRGNLAFRWFLADEVPARPEVRIVALDQAPQVLH